MSLKQERACRACLNTKTADLVSIFSGELRELYERCTALNVEDNDSYPKYLCVPCSDILESFSNFRKLCQQSEADWKVYIDKSKILSGDTTLIITKVELKEENFNDFDGDLVNHVDEWADTSPVTLKTHNIKKRKQKKVAPKQNKVTSFIGECDLCQKRFSYKTSLVKHVRTCVELNKGKPTTTNKDLLRYVPCSDALFCGICDESLDSTTEVSKHLDFHKASNDLACKICEYVAVDFADIFCHRFSHQPADIRLKRACYVCTRVFQKVETLEFHFRGKHLNKLPGLCKVCKKGFNNYKHFLQHQLVHTGLVYPCSVCNKTFTLEKTLRNHLTSHTGIKSFMCHLCGFKSRQASGLRSHTFRHHTEHKKIICNHCGKTFKNSETLREHTARVTAERTFPCPVCQKGYRTEKEMLNHVKWHSNDKPYTCNICGSSYKAKAHLRCHMRNHTGERPFVCNICNMSFTSTTVLKRHSLTHTGEKAYACEYCDKRFAAKNNLKKHVSRHVVAANDNTLRDLMPERTKMILPTIV